MKRGAWIAGRRESSPLAADDASVWVEFDSVPATKIPAFVSGAAFGFRQQAGHWICAGASVSFDGELTTARWRRVPIGLLVDQARQAAELLERAKPHLPATRPYRGSRGPDLTFYREVAELYRVAIDFEPRRPVEWMTVQLGTNGSDPVEQTRRWVRKARRLGFLGASIAGKPGEAPAVPDKRRRSG